MKGYVEEYKVIVLELTVEEAEWLKSLIQNALSDNESKQDEKMRNNLWEQLTECGIKTI